MKQCVAGYFFLHLLASLATAQTYVVSVPNADLTDGNKIVGAVRQGTQLYAHAQEGAFLSCINPETREPAWISKTDVMRRDISQSQADRLLEQRKRVTTLVNRGAASQADLAAVRSWMNETESVFGPVHPDTVRAIQLTGLIAADSRNLSEGRQFLQRAIDRAGLVFGKDSEEAAELHVDLAYLLSDMSLLADSARQAKAAAIIRANLFGGTHPKTMEPFLPLAQAMESISDDGAALGYYQKVYDSYEASYGAADQRSLKVAGRLADVAARLGRMDFARRFQSEILDALKSSEDPDQRWIGRIELKLKFIDLDFTQDSAIRAFLAQTEQFAEQQPADAGFASNLARQLVASLLSSGRTDAAFDVVDREMQLLRRKLRIDLWGLDEETQLAYLSYTAGQPFLEALDTAFRYRQKSEVVERSSEWLLNGKGLVREVNTVRSGYRHNVGKRQQWINQPYVSLREFRSALPQDSVFVDILQLPLSESQGIDHYVAWLTPKSGAQQVVDLGQADEIDEQISGLLKLLRETAMRCAKDGEDVAFARMLPALRELSDQLWGPIEDAVSEQKILLSPDGQTWLVPWSALLSHTGRFVIEDIQLQFHVSGREVVSEAAKVVAGRSVIFANPDFGEAPTGLSPDLRASESVGRIPPVNALENTIQEAAAARQTLVELTQQDVDVLLGANALEEAFKNLKGPSVVLLSTHGFFLQPDNLSAAADPLLHCGLLLAHANQHKDHTALNNDGVLTAVEVMGTDLTGTDLVVLSACETGIGSLSAAEGVTGLRSAFRLAGASCVVSTLWPIHDRETAYLIRDFFQALQNSSTASEALQRAQQQRITQHRERYGASHPFFWAAFTVTGHMSPDVLAQ